VGTEALAWPNPPTSTDLADGSDAYNMGIEFAVLVARDCRGISWRVPDSVVNPPGGAHVASLWRVADQALLQSKAFVPVPGGDQAIAFDAVVGLSPAERYIAAIYTNHYVFSAPTPSSGWTVTSPSGNVVADTGRLIPFNGGPGQFPNGTFNSWYYIGPLVDDGGGVSPSGIAVPVALGQPTAALSGAGPAGLAVPVVLGQPAAAHSLSAAPAGIAVPVAVGTPTVGLHGAAPAGLAAAVAVGSPTVALARSAAPAGVAVPVALGLPSTVDAPAPSAPGPWLETRSRPRPLVTETRSRPLAT
jgi:hypothetical protein